jgi:hypothetical protein
LDGLFAAVASGLPRNPFGTPGAQPEADECFIGQNLMTNEEIFDGNDGREGAWALGS